MFEILFWDGHGHHSVISALAGESGTLESQNIYIKKCLAVNIESKNLVVTQSHKFGCLSWSSVYAGILKK